MQDLEMQVISALSDVQEMIDRKMINQANAAINEIKRLLIEAREAKRDAGVSQ